MSEQQHCDHECVCTGYCQTCAVIDDTPCTRYDCKHDTRSRPHTPAPAQDEMEQRFQTKRQAWEQGYQDGGSAVQHDINLIEQAAARKARWNVLDVIKTHIGEYRSYRKDGSIEWSSTIDPDDLDTFIESLRLTQQQAGEQHE